MDLGLEIIGEITDVGPDEQPVPAVIAPARLRDSHHAVARLVALGQAPAEISIQTGYSVARLYTLARDPAFKDLVAFYRNDHTAIHENFMETMGLVARDALQEIHERLQDQPDRFNEDQLLDVFKVTADRAGFAPIQRTINKSIHTTIGLKFGAAEQRPLKKVSG
jgi:hypothetical protein